MICEIINRGKINDGVFLNLMLGDRMQDLLTLFVSLNYLPKSNVTNITVVIASSSILWCFIKINTMNTFADAC